MVDSTENTTDDEKVKTILRMKLGMTLHLIKHKYRCCSKRPGQ